MSIQCNKCHAIIDDNAKICHNCGNEINSMPFYCKICGAKLENRAVFCGKCGTKINSQDSKTDGFSVKANSNFIMGFLKNSSIATFKVGTLSYIGLIYSISLRIASGMVVKNQLNKE